MRRFPCTLPLMALLLTCSISACATSMQITSGSTNMCMNVVNHGSPEPGAPVIMKTCDPWRNQQWSFNGNGQITGVGGFCLDVQGSAPNNGAPVIYTPCSGSPSQNWVASNGTIVGIGGKCLDISGGVPAERAPLVINACNGSPSQVWVSH
jgi:Ricin-type beta-trefoil lectin domain